MNKAELIESLDANLSGMAAAEIIEQIEGIYRPFFQQGEVTEYPTLNQHDGVEFNLTSNVGGKWRVRVECIEEPES